MMESPQGFVEEIDFNELQFHEVVGKGAFGVVSRARWRGKDVAVKLIETESERKAFLTELKQLSRVNNPNIVKLYGASTKHPVCLVMEYAEGGSLYNVLHGSGPQPHYKAAHAMSWALQCTKGVEYLHNMKPKALIHRDLKPPNLLLIAGGTVLKICDFGTACDIQTHMTNNKGSAAWMAPEVFEGSNYSEKCDVFSCGIILWEVFTRRKPFDEIGGPAFRIMWAVHNGTRPPPIKNLPKPLETLMTRCWSGKPCERPSMAEVVRIMTHLSQFFKGSDEPLVYPHYSEYDYADYTYRRSPFGSNYSTPPSNTVYSHQSSPTMAESRTSTISDTVRHARDRGEPVPVLVQANQVRTKPPVVIEEDNKGQKSAPASLAASRESLFDTHRSSRAGTPVEPMKRYSADLDQFDILSQATPPAKGRGHRRVGSDECSRVTPVPVVTTSSVSRTDSPVRMGLFHTNTFPGTLNSVRESTPPNRSVSYPPPPSQRNQDSFDQGSRPSSWASVVHEIPQSAGAAGGINLADSYQLNMVHLSSFDAHLQPLIPNPSCQESLDIFREHQVLAQDYQRVQTEIALLTQRKLELMKEFEQDEQNRYTTNRLAEEYTQLSQENESLMLLHKNMKKQVEQIRHKGCGVN